MNMRMKFIVPQRRAACQRISEFGFAVRNIDQSCNYPRFMLRRRKFIAVLS